MFPKAMTPPNNNGYRIVIAGPIVIAGLTRNPVVVWHWIPDQDAMDASLPRGDKHERVERQEHEQPSFRKRDFE